MSTTRTQLAQAVSAAIGDILTGTATAGTPSTLLDTSDDSPFTGVDDDTLHKGAWLYVNTGTNAGIERRVLSYSPSTQTLTVANAVTGSYDATNGYELRGLTSRSAVVTAINNALTLRLFYLAKEPCGLLADGDGSMEDSGTASWTGTNATLTKEATTADFTQGSQSLKLVALASGAYAESRGILVTPGYTYGIEALVLPYITGSTKSSAALVVHDETNNATISFQTAASDTTAVYGTDGAAWKLVRGTFTVPSGCARITVRLTENTNGAISYWDDVVVFRKDGLSHQLPSWCSGPEYFEWAWLREYVYPYQELWTPVENVYLQFNRQATEAPSVRVSREATGRAVFVSGFRNYASLDTDDATTAAPLDWVVPEAVVDLLRPVVAARRHTDRKALLDDLHMWEGRAKIARQKYAPRRTYNPVRLPMGEY